MARLLFSLVGIGLTHGLMPPQSSIEKLSLLPSKNFNLVTQKYPWTYSELIDNIKGVDAMSVVKQDEGLGIVSLDSHHADILVPEDFHVTTILPDMLNSVVELVQNNNIPFDVVNLPKPVGLLNVVFSPVGFISVYIAIRLYSRFVQSGGGGPPGMNGFLRGNEKMEVVDVSDTTFEDVAGCDEAKFELTEIVDFLKNPERYEEAGAKIPRGVLLEGGPGTGKTLMARAVAGEADVPFLSISGSEFIEVFVGVGASRVRNLFEKAKELAPCVIFIDEIDAVGRQRGAGINSGNDEREQTLNQILTNMDGFNSRDGIIVLAATNRADILDNALLRPGRFDRKVRVPLPDAEGRKEIAKVHFRDKIIGNDVSYDEVSMLTSGFSGAEIANLANEAAILSVRKNATSISRQNVYDAFEKVTIGLPSNVERRSTSTLELVSCHETGHALIAALFDEFFTLRKVTIRANQGGAGGFTLFTPKNEYGEYPSKAYLLANLVVSLGGRAAEIIYYRKANNGSSYGSIFPEFSDLDITTGASGDLKQANSIARQYISKYGMGNFPGIYDPTGGSDNPFVGRNLGVSGGSMISESLRSQIDNDVTGLVEYALTKAIELIMLNEDGFNRVRKVLYEKQTIDGDEVKNLMTFSNKISALPHI